MTDLPSPPARYPYAARMALVNVCAALAVLVAFSRADGDASLRGLLVAFGVSLTFANCIGTPMALVMPTLGRRVFTTLRAPLNWAVMLLAMAAIALGGSVISILVLIAVGYLPSTAFVSWFLGSARTSVIITLTFGVGITLYETMRSRLERTTLALATKERDEAEARRIATEAQLASLESRVQPHFLFNTLNSIAALIPQDPAGAERMTGQLASLLRSSLDGADAPLVPLHQELRSVRDYLEIERVRFGDRLRFCITMPDGIERITVPRFSLQTLVENSVKFAVSPRREGGRVDVAAEATAAQVRLSVTDDGPGFDPAAAPEHHGLALLRERLALSFGERAALQVSSRPGHTCVTVTVPR
jgi:sensor histidine kinase YesM